MLFLSFSHRNVYLSSNSRSQHTNLCAYNSQLATFVSLNTDFSSQNNKWQQQDTVLNFFCPQMLGYFSGFFACHLEWFKLCRWLQIQSFCRWQHLHINCRISEFWVDGVGSADCVCVCVCVWGERGWVDFFYDIKQWGVGGVVARGLGHVCSHPSLVLYLWRLYWHCKYKKYESISFLEPANFLWRMFDENKGSGKEQFLDDPDWLSEMQYDRISPLFADY